jgi:hypothetical protein
VCLEGVAGDGGPFFFVHLLLMVDRKSTISVEKPRVRKPGTPMRNRARPLALVLAAGAVVLARPAGAVTQTATVNANIVKPLELVSTQNLDLGTISLTPGSWSGATVGISQAGVLSCANPNLVCSGTAQVAKYKVTGTNKMVVLIHAPNVVMVNQADGSKTLTLVTDSPSQITLTSSGEPGITFPIGGTITVSGSTAGGDYRGTFNVTVEYQ